METKSVYIPGPAATAVFIKVFLKYQDEMCLYVSKTLRRCFHTYLLLTSWCKIFFEKADSHSAYQTIVCFLYGTRRFITALTKDRHRNLPWACYL